MTMSVSTPEDEDQWCGFSRASAATALGACGAMHSRRPALDAVGLPRMPD